MSRLWMVCYDITDDRRRADVAKVLEGRGLRVQDSVFELFLDSREKQALQQLLAGLVDLAVDSVRLYPLCSFCRGDLAWQGKGGAVVDAHYFVI